MKSFVALGAAGAIVLTPLTFVPGCELIPPQTTSHYSRPGRPIARDRFARVDVFLAGDQPGRRYVVIGDVEVVARSRNTSLKNLLEYARRESRKLGGDAVVDVRAPQSAKARRDACGGAPTSRRTLTGTVVTWESGPR
jgi:uncharacterized protein YbjQ (UPF0145 family)